MSEVIASRSDGDVVLTYDPAEAPYAFEVRHKSRPDVVAAFDTLEAAEWDYVHSDTFGRAASLDPSDPFADVQFAPA